MEQAKISDAVAAAAFWRLVTHLQQRTDAQNVDLMGLAGFCRNCLSKWIEEAAATSGEELPADSAREAIYGMPYSAWKELHQREATPKQIKKMEESIARNRD